MWYIYYISMLVVGPQQRCGRLLHHCAVRFACLKVIHVWQTLWSTIACWTERKRLTFLMLWSLSVTNLISFAAEIKSIISSCVQELSSAIFQNSAKLSNAAFLVLLHLLIGFFKPLLGRTRSRVRCWPAIISLSHCPEPTGLSVHEAVDGLEIGG